MIWYRLCRQRWSRNCCRQLYRRRWWWLCRLRKRCVMELTVKFFKNFQIWFQIISLHVSGQCLQIKGNIVHGNKSAWNISLCFGNTLAATILVSVINLINLAKCTWSGKAASMSVASLAECVAQVISIVPVDAIARIYDPNLTKMLYKIDLQLLQSISELEAIGL